MDKICDIHTLILRLLQTLQPNLDFLCCLCCGGLVIDIGDSVPERSLMLRDI